jgi:hypothetical protein
MCKKLNPNQLNITCQEYKNRDGNSFIVKMTGLICNFNQSSLKKWNMTTVKLPFPPLRFILGAAYLNRKQEILKWRKFNNDILNLESLKLNIN